MTSPARQTQPITTTIDAAGKTLGRLATEVAQAVSGKRLPDYRPEQSPRVTVVIQNYSALKFDERKIAANQRYRVTGRPGGLKSTRWSTIYARDPKALLLVVIERMLPRTKHKKAMLKKITFAD